MTFESAVHIEVIDFVIYSHLNHFCKFFGRMEYYCNKLAVFQTASDSVYILEISFLSLTCAAFQIRQLFQSIHLIIQSHDWFHCLS